MLLLFSVALFVSAALLFAVEPMFARMVLPLLGGSPSVWNTAMVFYQAALLAGYGYAHLLSGRGLRWRAAHLAVMAAALLLLPLGLGPTQRPVPGGDPVGWLLLTMTATVGLPFLLLATTGPLLQRWFAHTGHPHARDPYFLYAASNVGSMVGLLAYPFVVEPRWTLAEQSRLWAIGYGLLLPLIAACAFVARAAASSPAMPRPDPAPLSDAPVTWRRRLTWVALAFVPSSLMLGVTMHFSMDIVAMPLLWIVPLAIYLLTFIVAFAARPLIGPRRAAQVLIFAVLGVLIVLEAHTSETLWLVVGLHLAALLAAGLTCHGLLAADRPGIRDLTEFYVWVAVGGVLGGAFNALLAPLVFRSVAEYPLVLIVACVLAPPWPRRARAKPDAGPSPGEAAPAPRVSGGDLLAAVILTAIVAGIIFGVRAAGHEWRQGEFVVLLAVLCFPLFAFRRRPVRFGLALGGVMLLSPLAGGAERPTLFAARSFFGIHRIQRMRTPAGTMHQLMHGTTVHGIQWVDPSRCDEPLGYYHRLGPAGQIFAAFGQAPGARRVGVAGLGTGALGAYAEAGQRWTFFEIDPVVVRIAADPRWFCYLDGMPAPPRVRLGDARLSIATDTTRYDVLVLDAYSSDAIPVHLLTREAFQEYFAHLTPHGVLVLHLSNRFFDLEPVVARIARDGGWSGRLRSDGQVSERERSQGRFPADWAVVAREERELAPLAGDPRWRRLRERAGVPLWTDSYSSLVSILR